MDEENYFEDSPDQRKKIIYLGAGMMLLAGMVFLAVFLGFSKKPEGIGFSEKEENKISYTNDFMGRDNCEKIKDERERQRCVDDFLLDEAVDERDFDKCYEIKTEDLKLICLHRVAQNLKNVDLCLKIPDDKTKDTCVADVAIALRDPAVCEVWVDEPFDRQECVDVTSAFVIAESGKTNDIAKCAELETNEYSNLCFWMSFNSKFSNDCDRVPKEYRAQCVDAKAIHSARSEEDCAPVTDPDYKDFCLLVAKMGMTQASNVDSDNDGITDGNEIFMKTDPKNPDSDGDTLTDGEEWIIYRTNPLSDDTDGDGLKDNEELKIYNTDPKKLDSDGDGISDKNEVLR